MTHPKHPAAKPYVETLHPYVPGRPIADVMREYGLSSVAKIASNESPMGAPKAALDAVAETLKDTHIYPDNDGLELIKALSAKHGVGAEQIVLSAGSSHLLELAARAYAGEGDEVIYSEYGFLCYPIFTKVVGATGIAAKEENYTASPQAMLEHITDKTKIIFIANPNNPTGTLLDEQTIRNFLDKVPAHILVVLDEAYTEYALADGGFDGVELVKDYANLLVCRTFSKVYGLAALRAGYGIAQPHIAHVLHKLRPPFSLSTPALAGATAALGAAEHIQKSVAHNKAEKDRLTKAYSNLGLLACESACNFLLLDISATKKTPQEIFMFMQQNGVIVRPVEVYGLLHHIRISIGTEAENNQALELFKHAVQNGTHALVG